MFLNSYSQNMLEKCTFFLLILSDRDESSIKDFASPKFLSFNSTLQLPRHLETKYHCLRWSWQLNKVLLYSNLLITDRILDFTQSCQCLPCSVLNWNNLYVTKTAASLSNNWASRFVIIVLLCTDAGYIVEQIELSLFWRRRRDSYKIRLDRLPSVMTP